MRVWIATLSLAVTFTAGPFIASAAESAVVTGKVVDASGKPMEHATVMVYEAGVKHGYGVYCPSCWPDCGKRAITDSEGSYRIGGLNPDLIFRLLVIQDGYTATYVKSANPAAGPAPTPFSRFEKPPKMLHR